jgi:hypothetical protein
LPEALVFRERAERSREPGSHDELVPAVAAAGLRKEQHQGVVGGQAQVSFDALQEPLSQRPDRVVDTVSSWYNGHYGMFILREARLLFNIFPDFPEAFESKLLNMVETANEEGLYVVLAILRNYKGRPVIHRVCRALIERLPLDSEFLNEIEFALMQDDIVRGEFGFFDAY